MDHMGVIATESARFRAVLAQAAEDAPVPSCPEWTAHDLAWHVAGVHQFWGRVLQSGVMDDDAASAMFPPDTERPATLAESLVVLESATATLLDELSRRGDDDPAWFWLPNDKSVGATRRMQMYEMTMHRVDAELTAGVDVTPIAADVATGAVDHAVSVMWAWGQFGLEFAPIGPAVALRCNDVQRSWWLQGGHWRNPSDETKPPQPAVQFADAGDRGELGGESTALIGSAHDLALWMWGRGPMPHIDGDADSVDLVKAAVSQGMG